MEPQKIDLSKTKKALPGKYIDAYDERKQVEIANIALSFMPKVTDININNEELFKDYQLDAMKAAINYKRNWSELWEKLVEEKQN